jgi:hypothetical protein
MRYEIIVKSGRGWSSAGTISVKDGPSLRQIAKHVSNMKRRRVVGIRPEGSGDRWYVYDFTGSSTMGKRENGQPVKASAVIDQLANRLATGIGDIDDVAERLIQCGQPRLARKLHVVANTAEMSIREMKEIRRAVPAAVPAPTPAPAMPAVVAPPSGQPAPVASTGGKQTGAGKVAASNDPDKPPEGAPEGSEQTVQMGDQFEAKEGKHYGSTPIGVSSVSEALGRGRLGDLLKDLDFAQSDGGGHEINVQASRRGRIASTEKNQQIVGKLMQAGRMDVVGAVASGHWDRVDRFIEEDRKAATQVNPGDGRIAGAKSDDLPADYPFYDVMPDDIAAFAKRNDWGTIRRIASLAEKHLGKVSRGSSGRKASESEDFDESVDPGDDDDYYGTGGLPESGSEDMADDEPSPEQPGVIEDWGPVPAGAGQSSGNFGPRKGSRRRRSSKVDNPVNSLLRTAADMPESVFHPNEDPQGEDDQESTRTSSSQTSVKVAMPRDIAPEFHQAWKKAARIASGDGSLLDDRGKVDYRRVRGIYSHLLRSGLGSRRKAGASASR